MAGCDRCGSESMPYFSGSKKYPKVCSPCRKVVEDQAKLALESEPEPAENERPQGVEPMLDRCSSCPFDGGCATGRCVAEECEWSPGAPVQHADTALKFDESKLPYHLMPLEAEAAIVRVLAFGAAKYKVENWREGFTWSRLYDAIRRHLAAFWAGEDLDPEDGEHHLAHLLCMATFLYVHAKQGIGTDDRLGVDGGVTEMFDVSDVVAKGHAARRDK